MTVKIEALVAVITKLDVDAIVNAANERYCAVVAYAGQSFGRLAQSSQGPARNKPVSDR